MDPDSSSNKEKEEWARWHLGASTLLMLIFGRAVSAPSTPSVPLGILASEQGHIITLIQLWNLRRIWKRCPEVFSSWFGRIALAVNTWSFGMLAHQLWEAFKAQSAFTEGIRKGGIAPRAGTTLGKWHLLLSLIPLFHISQRGKPLTFTQNVAYADLGKVDPDLLKLYKERNCVVNRINMVGRGRISKWLSMDIIRLADEPLADRAPNKKKRPILISIHGGAWALADKNILGLSNAVRLASRGIIVAVINYRMAPEVPFPAQILDCKRALIYLRKHAEEFGGDPNRIFCCGESAGGHLSALMGTTANLPEFQPPELKNEDTSLAGCLPLYGIYDIYGHLPSNEATRKARAMLAVRKRFFSLLVAQKPFNEENKHLFELASPSYHVRQYLEGKRDARNLPPFFLSHGNLDVLAAFDDALVFHRELLRVREKYGSWAPNEKDVFVHVSSGVHGYALTPSARAMALADAMADFIFHHVKRLDDLDSGKSISKSQL